MSVTSTATECPCCDAALVALPELAFCPTCGCIATNAVKAAIEIAELRRRLATTITGDIRLDVPNALATLNEGAWWELCGGHAVDFTAGSLARFVRASGFDIATLSVSHDERYVHLKATWAATPTRPSFDLEDDLIAIAAAVEAFPAAMERQIARWRRVIEELLGEGKRVAIRGSQTEIEAFMSKLRIDGTRVERVIDASCAPDVVVAFGDVAAEVRHELRRLGLRPLVLTP